MAIGPPGDVWQSLGTLWVVSGVGGCWHQGAETRDTAKQPAKARTAPSTKPPAGKHQREAEEPRATAQSPAPHLGRPPGQLHDGEPSRASSTPRPTGLVGEGTGDPQETARGADDSGRRGQDLWRHADGGRGPGGGCADQEGRPVGGGGAPRRMPGQPFHPCALLSPLAPSGHSRALCPNVGSAHSRFETMTKDNHSPEPVFTKPPGVLCASTKQHVTHARDA